jgi:hypothetical protein
MVDLTYELVTARNKNPLTFPFALLHVTFTLLSQLVGVTSRFVIATLALVPVERHGTLSGGWRHSFVFGDCVCVWKHHSWHVAMTGCKLHLLWSLYY